MSRKEGWGADEGLPGMVLDDDAGIIQVFVFEPTELPDHWDRLDDFEGPGYRRQAVEAETDEGRVAAFIYEVVVD